ncbi:uncharacterized protein LOC117155037 [Bombus vancouverensis nearcticus]|uniref:uncharacterized protein LOC117155037 n=1 Tax=Bombus vancouverensis nearcticus TaxID=2705178 RepID=UPI00143AF00F|nr:uncharacterized protein LOC117155037 [Bombus vancouverensis nearcticus]
MSQRRMDPRISPVHSPEGGGSNRVGLFSLWKCPSICDAQGRRFLACISATLTMAMVGTVYGWTNTSFVPLTSGIGDVPLRLTHDEYSWSVSLTVLSSMIGSLLAAQLADRIGRKYCLIACSLVFAIGWLYMYSANSVPELYIARGILGIGVGIARTINPMFVSEVADIKQRGHLSTLIAANVYFGSLLTYVTGPSLTYTSHLLALAGISAISTLPLMCLRETPYFLVAKGKKERACRSIAYYKGIEDPDQVKVELRALRAEARYGIHQESRRDLTPPYSINLPSPLSRDLPPPYNILFPPLSIRDLPPPYRSISPSRSIRETHLEPTREVVGPEATPDLDLPSSSDSHSQSIPSVHSKFKCEVRTQATGELRVEYSRDSHGLPLQTTRELHSQSASDLHRPSTSQIHRPPTSQIHPDPTCEIHQASTSRIHRPPTSQIHPDPTCEVHQASTSQIHRPSTSQILPERRSELHSQTRSDLHTPTRVDSRASTDMSEPYMDLTKYTCLEKLRAILQRSNKRALFIVLGLIMTQHLSAKLTATQYLQDFINRKRASIGGYNALICVDVICLVSSYLTAFTVNCCGGRILLILSTFWTSYVSFVLSFHFFKTEHKSDDFNNPTYSLVHLILYQVVFQIGLGTLPNVFLCDLFPTKLKGIVGAIVVIFDGIIGFTASKLNQVIADNIGSSVNYKIYTTSCCVAFLMTILWVPETRGKTYREIEALLVGENLNGPNEEVSSDEMDSSEI